MQLFDTIVDAALAMPDPAEQKDFLWGAVVYLKTGEFPDELMPYARASLIGQAIVLRNSRARSVSGRKGGAASCEKGDAEIPFDEIVAALNEAAGTRYKASSREAREKIRARWNEGYTLDQFKEVIRKKAIEWLDDEKMRQYLRPKTIFGTNFEAYLNQPEPKKRGGASAHGEYD